MLMHIIRAVRFLACQGLPLRGLFAEDTLESDSNYQQLLKLPADYDKDCGEWLKQQVNKYARKTSLWT